MSKLVSVAVRDAKSKYYLSGTWNVTVNDLVLVSIHDGVEIGQVKREIPLEIYGENLPAHITEIVRKASDEDLKKCDAIRKKENDYFKTCCEKIKKYNLPMLLQSAEILFDESKVIFNYYAENRVDFRELVKDLAETFRCRIEMHQIGEREKASAVSGMGQCGQALCCSQFMKEFQPVTIRMAREQEITMSGDRLMGLCGKLKCCLRYEIETSGANAKAAGGELKPSCSGKNCGQASCQSA